MYDYLLKQLQMKSLPLCRSYRGGPGKEMGQIRSVYQQKHCLQRLRLSPTDHPETLSVGVWLLNRPSLLELS